MAQVVPLSDSHLISLAARVMFSSATPGGIVMMCESILLAWWPSGANETRFVA